MALAPPSGSIQSESPSSQRAESDEDDGRERGRGNLQANVIGILSAATRSTSGILAWAPGANICAADGGSVSKEMLENKESHVQMQYSPEPFARVILRI